MTAAVHQFHPVLAPGDATSAHILALRDRIRVWGHPSEAYAVEIKPGLEGEVLSYRRLFRVVRPEDTLILHFSIGSEAFGPLAKLVARRILVYHNVTPPEFFVGINTHAAAYARLGLRQLRALAPSVELAVGVSEFNRRALVEAGYVRTACAPILVDWSRYEVAPDERVLSLWRSFRVRLLFVGRVSPNKRQDDLLRMLAYYRRAIEPEAQLIMVGAYRDQPRYYERLLSLRTALDLDRAATFTGPVGMSELVSYYRVATCFVSLSEHEGFGVPLLEAMRFRVPIVAYDAGAVGETANGAAILLRERDLAEAAEAADIAARAPVRDRLLAAGDRRLEAFEPEAVAARLRDILEL